MGRDGEEGEESKSEREEGTAGAPDPRLWAEDGWGQGLRSQEEGEQRQPRWF